MIDEEKLEYLRELVPLKDLGYIDAKEAHECFDTIEALWKVARQFESEHRTHFGSGSIEPDHCEGCAAFDELNSLEKKK